MEVILRYFPELTHEQMQQFKQLEELYREWNAKINVVSRKDIDELYIRHVLHSLGIAKVMRFQPGARVLDVGTGGGFPGIPLAILHPETHFYLVDSIAKKLKVVQGVADAIGLQNIKVSHSRVEAIDERFDFIVSRAVTTMPKFVKWIKGKIEKDQNHDLKNGILYLKGGDLTEELKVYQTAQIYELSDFFIEDFFETKKVVHLPLKYKG
ncbi:16S rRNA (guanine(527)-N(7))-methyltransferase RsmG [Psychroserpens sp.]|uniref:16S rRNA (guanine(527)-N(7))-methyltransferase RsmG n=1 Tax=Psychroserpens sp. TaxID=2020870 RepID=UPI001B192CAD|nr:16S rRNA (guanine(527)-N(7))-methyltransferase RsmG [Psychroserpens sp.]MBO6605897.1 16S rRNA (guanine(527)-N(7))-methyltransferase RsmG [Psychroserpens sp.]MBO6652732.1 16S rRNA (guanine(527)-N(7))-methyltransferase RsmG [Psychroserpens sp.]MBO6681496.1 16S rRNA (guanine(527)-N(7))-methyltransferase RsmG [Psychroserpens sp.]MBO6749271.1 16S rRNA (guanine(527)-N(7))-methyltransferase RsmG [Psychroserpens sp.]MBO6914283.1 16S rRNA (guanine(527)-N(7))-methyltransferase RsmG [Psychroserpens sp